jgi:hypothetical protein
MTKCRELNAELVANAAKVQSSLQVRELVCLEFQGLTTRC